MNDKKTQNSVNAEPEVEDELFSSKNIIPKLTPKTSIADVTNKQILS